MGFSHFLLTNPSPRYHFFFPTKDHMVFYLSFTFHHYQLQLTFYTLDIGKYLFIQLFKKNTHTNFQPYFKIITIGFQHLDSVNCEQPCNTLRPDVMLSLIPALELDDATRHRLQGEVPPVLTALEEVPPGPRRNILHHLHYYI